MMSQERVKLIKTLWYSKITINDLLDCFNKSNDTIWKKVLKGNNMNVKERINEDEQNLKQQRHLVSQGKRELGYES